MWVTDILFLQHTFKEFEAEEQIMETQSDAVWYSRFCRKNSHYEIVLEICPENISSPFRSQAEQYYDRPSELRISVHHA